MARAESTRIIISMAAQFKWKLHHLDVKSAFLNGYIEEDIYVDQPKDFIKERKDNYVLKLRKALYSLRQAPRAWNSKLDETSKKSRNSKIEMSKHFDSSKHLRIYFPSKRENYYVLNLGMTARSSP